MPDLYHVFLGTFLLFNSTPNYDASVFFFHQIFSKVFTSHDFILVTHRADAGAWRWRLTQNVPRERERERREAGTEYWARVGGRPGPGTQCGHTAQHRAGQQTRVNKIYLYENHDIAIAMLFPCWHRAECGNKSVSLLWLPSWRHLNA